jgi:hypothetical protein
LNRKYGPPMFRSLNKSALYGACLLLILCGTVTRSAGQNMLPQVTKFTSLDTPDLERGEPIDPTSRLLWLGNQIRETEMDCSHFVQYVYEQAGLYYGYTPSRVLYEGIRDFKRVLHPKAGDLIVWRGHVGIVVDPEETTFLSALRSGVKTSSYQSSYWKKRGRPHFLRYIGMGQDAAPLWTMRRAISSRTGSSGE